MKTITLRKLEAATPTFTAKAAAGVLELHFDDVIGADFFGEGITAKSVRSAIDAAGNYDSILCNVNSPGGDLIEAVSIYNHLKSLGKPVNCRVTGMAASAASIIAMAADKVEMGTGTLMMIHNAMMMNFGDANDMRKAADVLDTASSSAADVYVAKTGMDKKAIQKMMDAETWMDPEECIKNGFADSVADYPAQTEAVTAKFDLSLYNHVPEKLQARDGHTKRVDGENLGPEDFIYVGDPEKTDTWALPWHFSTEEKTVSHLRDALARFDQDTTIPESAKPAAHAKLVRLAKEHGIEVAKDDKGTKAAAEVNIVGVLEVYRKKLALQRGK